MASVENFSWGNAEREGIDVISMAKRVTSKVIVQHRVTKPNLLILHPQLEGTREVPLLILAGEQTIYTQWGIDISLVCFNSFPMITMLFLI